MLLNARGFTCKAALALASISFVAISLGCRVHVDLNEISRVRGQIIEMRALLQPNDRAQGEWISLSFVLRDYSDLRTRFMKMVRCLIKGVLSMWPRRQPDVLGVGQLGAGVCVFPYCSLFMNIFPSAASLFKKRSPRVACVCRSSPRQHADVHAIGWAGNVSACMFSGNT